jgi:hypothetical protein
MDILDVNPEDLKSVLLCSAVKLFSKIRSFCVDFKRGEVTITSVIAGQLPLPSS